MGFVFRKPEETRILTLLLPKKNKNLGGKLARPFCIPREPQGPEPSLVAGGERWGWFSAQCPGLPLATYPGSGQGLGRDTTQVPVWDGGQSWLVGIGGAG